ncbi:MAG: hypothetical protein IPM77_02050 [Crocinitomicaceae bacterium]|nr:hypothetical protein [Crocinitomicaceae bacterium]
MRTHQIHTIKGSILSKADHDVLRETNHATYYKFNKFGELTFEYKTVLNDTIFTLYVYDERSNLIIKRTADKFGFESCHYRYDSQNRLISKEVRIQSNTGQDKYLHVPDESFLQRTEKYEYVELGTDSYKKNYLNNSGTIYREEFFYFDDKNRLIRQEAYQKSGSGKSVLEVFYNENGQLIEKKATSSVMENYSTSYQYEYDESGNIYAMKFYENDVYKTEFQFVYDSESGYLKAIISRDVETQRMTIVKYDSYTFFLDYPFLNKVRFFAKRLPGHQNMTRKDEANC